MHDGGTCRNEWNQRRAAKEYQLAVLPIFLMSTMGRPTSCHERHGYNNSVCEKNPDEIVAAKFPPFLHAKIKGNAFSIVYYRDPACSIAVTNSSGLVGASYDITEEEEILIMMAL